MKSHALVGGGHAVHADREDRRPRRKKLHRLEVSRAKNGGHVVRHHFAQAMGPYAEPQEHVFGKADGAALLAHLGRHLGVKGAMPATPEEPGGPAGAPTDEDEA